MKMSEEEYRENSDDYNGYCTNCKDIGRYGSTEPDARNYECEDCGKKTCFGIEEALVMGLIEIE